jgi:hypothetical protein
MANSYGGIIIYGVSECQDKLRKHLPEKSDPIDRTQLPKEWLEHVINNIRPKIEGLVIHPVPINTASNHVVYVVEIPQSWTVHQAIDKRYYKRYNFESVPMEDDEIRDVMVLARQQHPKIDLKFEIEISLTYYEVGIGRQIGLVTRIQTPDQKRLLVAHMGIQLRQSVRPVCQRLHPNS